MEPQTQADRTLYRSRHDRMIAGVCGGISEYFGIDPTLVRLAAVLLLIVGNAGTLIVYIILAIVVPEAPLQAASGGETMQPEQPESRVSDSPVPPPAPQDKVHQAIYEPTPSTPAPVRGRPSGGGIVVGLALVLIGIALLANRFVPGLDLLRLWPLIIVIIGVRMMFTGGDES